jgi:hypothetical protein
MFAAAPLAAALVPALARAAPMTRAEVWKSPTCGCCVDWIKHFEANGFQVRVHDTGNDDARAVLGMPVKFGGCHTAVVEGYVIEGHVPAREVRRLLRERPRALGLAVPGMPFGSPGMDQPQHGGRRDAYNVLLVKSDGSSTVYQSYR